MCPSLDYCVIDFETVFRGLLFCRLSFKPPIAPHTNTLQMLWFYISKQTKNICILPKDVCFLSVTTVDILLTLANKYFLSGDSAVAN